MGVESKQSIDPCRKGTSGKGKSCRRPRNPTIGLEGKILHQKKENMEKTRQTRNIVIVLYVSLLIFDFFEMKVFHRYGVSNYFYLMDPAFYQSTVF